MLVLTRKCGQSLVIGNHIRITLLSTNGDMARIGVDASKEVPVHREEVYQRILAENAQLGIQENYLRIAINGLTLIIEPHELINYIQNESAPVPVQVVKMTRQQFEALEHHD